MEVVTRLRRAPGIGASGLGIADACLIAGIARRDANALADAYRSHGPAVRDVAGRICGAGLAEDVAQDVFVNLWRRPAVFDARHGSLRSFLLMQARSRSIDLVRGVSARERRELRWSGAERPSGMHDDVDPPAGILGDDVRAALLVLSVPERAAIVLAYFGGLTYREVAVLLDEPEGTVKSRIRSGLRRMRSILTIVNAEQSPGPDGPAWAARDRAGPDCSELGHAAKRQEEAGGDDARRGHERQRTGQ